MRSFILFLTLIIFSNASPALAANEADSATRETEADASDPFAEDNGPFEALPEAKTNPNDAAPAPKPDRGQNAPRPPRPDEPLDAVNAPEKKAAIESPALADAEDANHRGKGVLSPFTDFSWIYAKDEGSGEKYDISATRNLGAQFLWTQAQLANLNSRIGAGVQAQTYGEPAGKSLTENRPTLWMLSVGGEYLLSDWLHIDGDIAAQHELFVRRVSATELALDRLVIPQARLGIKFPFFHAGKFQLAIGAEGLFFYERSPTNAPSQVRIGSGFGASLSLSQHIARSFALGLTAQLRERLQNTELTHQRQRSYKAALDFIFLH